MSAETSRSVGFLAESGAQVEVHNQTFFFGDQRLLLHYPFAEAGGASPTQALRPSARLVELGDERAALLATLTKWATAEDAPLKVAVVQGSAGTGKTRLCGELVYQLRARRWRAGLVTEVLTEAQAAHDTERDRKSALLVVDYAEAAPTSVLRLLKGLLDQQHADRDADRAPATRRVVLAIRSARAQSSWADEIASYATGEPDRDDVRALLGRALEIPLAVAEYALGEVALKDLYVRAWHAYRARFQPKAPARARITAPYYIGAAPFTTPLIVSAAAFLHAAPGKPRVIGPAASADDVLDELLAHERRYWARSAKDAGRVVKPLLREAAATVFTVAPAQGPADASRLLCAIDELSDAGMAGERANIVAWWQATYPHVSGHVRPIEPDLVGERLIAQRLGAGITDAAARQQVEADGSALLLAIADRASLAGRRALLRTMTRGAADSGTLRSHLQALIHEHLASLIDDALADDARASSGEPLLVTLAQAIASLATLGDAAAAADGVRRQRPEHAIPVAERQLIAELTMAAARTLAATPRQDAETRSRRAELLAEAAALYRSIGRRADALAPSEDAVGIRRHLAADDSTYLPRLAASLSNLGVSRSELGQHTDAVVACEEAVSLYRGLSEDPAHLPALATSLTNLGVCRGRLGQSVDAVLPSEQAVAIRRGLAADDPAFLPDLAASLTNLGIALSALDRDEEALAPSEEAVTVYRGLAGEDPAHLPGLAASLRNFGLELNAVGRVADALPPMEEAVRIRRRLASENPAYLPGLASGVHVLAGVLGDLERHSEALRLNEEALTLRRRLAADNRTFLPDLAGSLMSLGHAFGELGRPAEGLLPSEEAVTVYREIAGENHNFLPELAESLGSVGATLTQLGRHAEALSVNEEAVIVYRGVAAEDPDYLPELGASLMSVGSNFTELGRNAEALPVNEEAVIVYRGLAAEDPDYIPELSSSLTDLGLVLDGLGRHEEALLPDREAVAIDRALVADDAAYLADLATSLTNLGDTLGELGRHEEALAASEEAVTIDRALAADDPACLADLAEALDNLAKALSALDRYDASLCVRAEAVAVCRRLAADDPALLPRLAETLQELSSSLKATGREAEALEAAKESTALRTLGVGDAR